MKIYLDDERPTPDGWVRTYTVRQTIDLLLNPNIPTITHLSLDNDLGDGQPEGHQVLDWLEERCWDDTEFPIPHIQVHSANPTRVTYMLKVAERIKRRRG